MVKMVYGSKSRSRPAPHASNIAAVGPLDVDHVAVADVHEPRVGRGRNRRRRPVVSCVFTEHRGPIAATRALVAIAGITASHTGITASKQRHELRSRGQPVAAWAGIHGLVPVHLPWLPLTAADNRRDGGWICPWKAWGSSTSVPRFMRSASVAVDAGPRSDTDKPVAGSTSPASQQEPQPNEESDKTKRRASYPQKAGTASLSLGHVDRTHLRLSSAPMSQMLEPHAHHSGLCSTRRVSLSSMNHPLSPGSSGIWASPQSLRRFPPQEDLLKLSWSSSTRTQPGCEHVFRRQCPLHPAPSAGPTGGTGGRGGVRLDSRLFT